MKNNEKKISLLTITISIIVITMSLTYAFLETEIPPFINDETKTKVTTADKLYLTYTDCVEESQSDCANISKDLTLGESITKSFQIKNDTLQDAYFDLYFKELLNTFTNDELVYKIENLDTGEELVPTTAVPQSETTSEMIKVKEQIFIEKDATQKFRLTVTFIQKSDNQNENLDANYSIKLSIKPRQ